MKKAATMLIGSAGVLLVVGVVMFWPARAVPKSSSRQTIKYDAVKNATYVTKDGFTFCIAGNLTNGTAFKTNTP
jgi:nitrate reductase gamma subunit